MSLQVPPIPSDLSLWAGTWQGLHGGTGVSAALLLSGNHSFGD